MAKNHTPSGISNEIDGKKQPYLELPTLFSMARVSPWYITFYFVGCTNETLTHVHQVKSWARLEHMTWVANPYPLVIQLSGG